MTAVLTDLRELTRPLSAFAAFQLGHFCPPGIQLSMEKDNSFAGKSVVGTDLVLNRAILPHSLYTHICTKSYEVPAAQSVDASPLDPLTLKQFLCRTDLASSIQSNLDRVLCCFVLCSRTILGFGISANRHEFSVTSTHRDRDLVLIQHADFTESQHSSDLEATIRV
jgi:hypothetical protein